MDLKSMLQIAILAAEEASKEILTVYHSGDFQAEAKGDNSPLTLADKKGHDAIAKILQQSNLPVLSEEGRSILYEERKDWDYFWMVDPLDGTKEFLKRNGATTPLAKRNAIDLAQPALRIVASRSHMSEETQEFINKLTDPTLVSQGSSLKFMLLAEGKADVYPRFAPTMEWDTAAAHAVVKSVGLNVFQHGTTDEVVYNKIDLLNPWFLVI